MVAFVCHAAVLLIAIQLPAIAATMVIQAVVMAARTILRQIVIIVVLMIVLGFVMILRANARIQWQKVVVYHLAPLV